MELKTDIERNKHKIMELLDNGYTGKTLMVVSWVHTSRSNINRSVGKEAILKHTLTLEMIV